MLKIKLTNPITEVEVNSMIENIIKTQYSNLLLIDFGNHNFESLETLKLCKERLMFIEKELLVFSKIAMVTVPPYKNASKNSDVLKFFYTEKEAEEWLFSA